MGVWMEAEGKELGRGGGGEGCLKIKNSIPA